MSGLEGRVALVTGGSRGIGAAVAERLAAEGADVAITYVSTPAAAASVVGRIERRGRRGLAIAADSADPAAVVAAVERTADELGRLDILVNNAGFFPAGPLEEVTLDEVDRTLAVHARAPFLASQAAARVMSDGGRIVSIGSTMAEHAGDPGLTLYAMSKAALAGMTRGLARDLGARGITANVVHPGNTDTGMNPADAPEAERERALTPLGRYAAPADVAASVAHLAGPDGAFVSGAALTVDGGRTA